jgi:ATP-binding protein involved in chromosome partitioning
MVKAGDEGKPFILQHADSPTGKAVDAVMENLINLVEKENDSGQGYRRGKPV